MEKEKRQHTIVLKSKTDRDEFLKLLSTRKGKVLHDSGERVLIIEVPKGTRLRGVIPVTTKIFALKDEIRNEISKPSQHELLFIDALKLRTSKAFLDEKKKRKPGTSPEELEMFKASDFIGEAY